MTTTRLANLDLKEDAIEALAFNPRIDSTAIAVRAEDGVVTLTGNVRSLAEIWEAEETVKQLSGVRAIASDLVVELPGTHKRNDSDIALDIEHRFASDIYIPETVKSLVKDGHVTLSGTVTTFHERQESVAVARRVRGVRSVSAHITIESPVHVVPSEVDRRIHSWFTRSADRAADYVHVTVRGSHVTLSGSVRTLYDRDRAMIAAWETPGVTAVTEHLTIGS